MTERGLSPGAAADLRWRAEEKAGAGKVCLPERMSPEEARKLLQNLQVHQIELEMQNEELRRTQQKLETSHARYFDLYDMAPVGYCTLNEKGLILTANLTAANLLGVTMDLLVNKPLSRFIDREDQDTYYLQHRKLLDTCQPQTFEVRMVRKGDSPIWARVQATAGQDGESGAPVCRIALFDISDRKHAEDELRHTKELLELANCELQRSFELEQQLARTDGLTGLFNYRYFFELAAREFSAAVRYKRPLTIFMFDLDGLKQINDTFGHTAGDKVLEMVARTTAAQVRDADVLARYGGDEFIMLLPQTSAREALPIAERIRKSVAATRVETGKGTLSTTLSIGIAEMISKPKDASVNDVARRADEALYAAKTAGGNRISPLDQPELIQGSKNSRGVVKSQSPGRETLSESGS